MIYLREDGEIEVGCKVIFTPVDDELIEWKESHPSYGYKVVEVDKETDGTPTGMIFIEGCDLALDVNEDQVERIKAI